MAMMIMLLMMIDMMMFMMKDMMMMMMVIFPCTLYFLTCFVVLIYIFLHNVSKLQEFQTYSFIFQRFCVKSIELSVDDNDDDDNANDDDGINDDDKANDDNDDDNEDSDSESQGTLETGDRCLPILMTHSQSAPSSSL